MVGNHIVGYIGIVLAGTGLILLLPLIILSIRGDNNAVLVFLGSLLFIVGGIVLSVLNPISINTTLNTTIGGVSIESTRYEIRQDGTAVLQLGNMNIVLPQGTYTLSTDK